MPKDNVSSQLGRRKRQNPMQRIAFLPPLSSWPPLVQAHHTHYRSANTAVAGPSYAAANGPTSFTCYTLSFPPPPPAPTPPYGTHAAAVPPTRKRAKVTGPSSYKELCLVAPLTVLALGPSGQGYAPAKEIRSVGELEDLLKPVSPGVYAPGVVESIRGWLGSGMITEGTLTEAGEERINELLVYKNVGLNAVRMGQYHCVLCDVSSDRWGRLVEAKAHCEKVSTLLNLNLAKVEGKRYGCPFCDMSYSRNDSLQNHIKNKHSTAVTSSTRSARRSAKSVTREAVEQSPAIPTPESLGGTNFAPSLVPDFEVMAGPSYLVNATSEDTVDLGEAPAFHASPAGRVDSHFTQPQTAQFAAFQDPTAIAVEANAAVDDSPFLPIMPRQDGVSALPIFGEEDIFSDIDFMANWTNDSTVDWAADASGSSSTYPRLVSSSNFVEFADESHKIPPSSELTPVRSTASTPPPRRERIIFRDTKDFEDGYYEAEFSPYEDDLPRDHLDKYDWKATSAYFSSTDLYASPPKPKRFL